MKLRIATYNVHKCRGIDGRTLPERIAGVILRLKADAIAVQEILADQAIELEGALRLPGYTLYFGENRKINGVSYGNAVFSRLPVELARNYDLTHGMREERGALRADLRTPAGLIHLFNVHLGTSYSERREQAALLLAEEILLDLALTEHRVICGDFNDWNTGPCSRAMAQQFRHSRPRSFPALLPLLRLDHIYFDCGLALEHTSVFRQGMAWIASDHLPVTAEFRV